MRARVIGSLFFCGITLAIGVSPARASAIEVNVLGTAGPWSWVDGGLNGAYKYGVGDHTAPSVVQLSSLGLGPGQVVFIRAQGGATDAFGNPPSVNYNGHVGSVFKDDTLGSSGEPLPSLYTPAIWGSNTNDAASDCSADPNNPCLYGVFLNALMFAVTDANHNILFPFSSGHVIAVGDGNGGFNQAFVIGVSFFLPANAAFLEFGVNDDIFADNTGSLQVCVASTGLESVDCVAAMSEVPEPASLTLFGLGSLGLGAIRRRQAKRSK